MALSIAYLLPGVLVSVALDAEPSTVAPNKRGLIFGYAPSTSTKPFNVPWQPATTREAREAHTEYAHLTHAFEAAKSQLPAGIGAELWLVPLAEPSSGTAATHFVEFLAAPSGGVLGTNTDALAPDTCTVEFRGRGGTFGIDVGDDFATIATKAKTMLDEVADLPVTITRSGAKLTATDRHKGEHGNEMPIKVSFASKGASGVAASPGTFTFSGTATVGGSAVIGLDSKSVTVTIGGTNTPVNSATATRTKIRQNGYCVDCALPFTPADGVVTLFYRDGEIAHRLTISLVTVATQTVAKDVGTAGVGVPDLTDALDVLESLPAFRGWSVFWEDTANWSATITHIEAEAEAPTLKRQRVFACQTSRGELLRSANLREATTPALSSSPRYSLFMQQGSAQAGFEHSARCLAEFLSRDFQAPNLNGARLKTDDGVPNDIPAIGARMGRDERNTLVRDYGYAPIVVDGGNYNAIEGAFTTYRNQGTRDYKYRKVGALAAVDFMADDLTYALALDFSSKSLKAKSKSRTKDTVDLDSVKGAIATRMLYWDDELDIYDGAKLLIPAVMASVKLLPTRITAELPINPVADLDQIDVTALAQ